MYNRMAVFATDELRRRFKQCPVECPKLRQEINSLSEYVEVISSTVSGTERFWFRGHEETSYSLTPTALRYRKREDRRLALDLMADFKRIAEIKLSRPPAPNDELKWAQIGQHYGLPTRLLDWTESATTALYFACLKTDFDGIVFVLNPVALNRLSHRLSPNILDPQRDEQIILRYLRSGPQEAARGRFPVAINPVWNSERLINQKGVFTLHGSRFTLDKGRVPSLAALLIPKESKRELLSQLQRVGVDEMTLFPELEHSCRHLLRTCGLPRSA
jgi:FRG domain